MLVKQASGEDAEHSESTSEKRKESNRDFSFTGSSVDKTPRFHAGGKPLIPGWGAKILQAVGHGQEEIKKKMIN